MESNMAQALRNQKGNRSKYDSSYALRNNYVSINSIRGQCNLDNSNPNGLSGIHDIHTWACFRDLELRKLIFKDDKRFNEIQST